MPLIVYGMIFSPPTRAVLITAETIGLKLELKPVDLGKKEHLTPEFLKINPHHTIPVLDDNGTIVIDSHAIVTYLVSKYGENDTLYPKDLTKRAAIDAKLHFDSGVVFSILKITFKAHAYEGQTEYLTDWQRQKIQEAYELLNTILERSQWIAGDNLTVADISLFTTVVSLTCILPVNKTLYPKVDNWLSKAALVPSFALNKEGAETYSKAWQRVSKH